ncbi:MAG: hypothetical protein IID35_09325 [Planctomycetes bacterium]|nr:hypothetical protein [Planctomycetota bacterium]
MVKRSLVTSLKRFTWRSTPRSAIVLAIVAALAYEAGAVAQETPERVTPMESEITSETCEAVGRGLDLWPIEKLVVDPKKSQFKHGTGKTPQLSIEEVRKLKTLLNSL